MKRLALILALIFISFAAPAVEPDEILDNPQLEQRARDISAHLRCLVCQNQSIDDSDADLARDLRLLVRERLVEGDSNEEAIQYVVDRYGEFVLLNPVFAWHTLILWIFAPLILVFGAVALFLARRKSGNLVQPTPMTPDEAAALKALEEEAEK